MICISVVSCFFKACEGDMKIAPKIFLLVFCCSLFVGAQVCEATGVKTNATHDFLRTVRPGQIVGGMFWAGLWAGLADLCTSLVLEPKPRRIVDLAVFFYGTYHYVSNSYRENKAEAASKKI
jgi:hypothetical protein